MNKSLDVLEVLKRNLKSQNPTFEQTVETAFNDYNGNSPLIQSGQKFIPVADKSEKSKLLIGVMNVIDDLVSTNPYNVAISIVKVKGGYNISFLKDDSYLKSTSYKLGTSLNNAIKKLPFTFYRNDKENSDLNFNSDESQKRQVSNALKIALTELISAPLNVGIIYSQKVPECAMPGNANCYIGYIGGLEAAVKK